MTHELNQMNKKDTESRIQKLIAENQANQKEITRLASELRQAKLDAEKMRAEVTSVH